MPKTVFFKFLFTDKKQFHFPEGIADFCNGTKRKTQFIETEIKRHRVKIIAQYRKVGEQHHFTFTQNNTLAKQISAQVLPGALSL